MIKVLLLGIFLTAFVNAVADDDKICGYSEIAFCLDVSETINKSEFRTIKQFTKQLAREIGMSEKGNHIAVATFADKARKNIYCNQHQSIESFEKDVEKMVQYGKWTNIEDGLRKARELLQEQGCGNRPVESGKSVIIIMTDGTANVGTSRFGWYNISKDIRENSKIDIFAIGVGSADTKLLNQVVGGDENKVIKADTFQDLLRKEIIKSLKAVGCTTPAPIITTTTTTPTPTTTTPTTTTPTPTTTTATTTTPTTTTPTPTTTTPTPTTTTPTPTTTTPTTTAPTTTAPTTTAPSTTTPTPTTTTPTPTTTTPTPTPTTTTPKTTTTTITTEKFKFPPPCDCKIEKHEFGCMKWTKHEIITKFEGNCVLDKLKLAFKYITKDIMDIQDKINAFNTCAEKLKYMIISSDEENYDFEQFFESRDQCVNGSDCKLKFWLYQLEAKKILIEKEIKFEEEGFGSSSFLWSPMYDYAKKMAEW